MALLSPPVLVLLIVSTVMLMGSYAATQHRDERNRPSARPSIRPGIRPVARPSGSDDCPDYSSIPDKPTREFSVLPSPHGFCVGLWGYTAVVSWTEKKFQLFDNDGKLILTVDLPAGAGSSGDCVLAGDALLISNVGAKVIYHYDLKNHRWEANFAEGRPFLRMVEGHGYLYVGVAGSRDVLIYSICDGYLIHTFQIKAASHARGMAFDTENNLHIMPWAGATEEVWDAAGTNLLATNDYKGMGVVDGIAISSENIIALADRRDGQVGLYEFLPNVNKVKVLKGKPLMSPIDVDINWHTCELYVLDFKANKVFVY